MKPLFCAYSKILIAVAVVVAATIGTVSQAQPQPAPPAPVGSALPADIVPGSPLAEVVKLLQAGVDASTIKSYILNAPSAFNLDTDKILFLKDAGAPSDLINTMLDRDKALYAATVTPPPAPAPVPAVDNSTPSTPDVAPPPPDMTLDSFNNTLAPYGSWVNVEGYGQCWRPTTVIYDASWSPYCDRGNWIYTDYGWYWDSDYAWGVTFHYGRWFLSPQFGWCWCPDTVWAPSWVIWRSDEEYCGWAPLPPFAVFSPGSGFLYRGAPVGLDFDFGLGPECFVFVSVEHFNDRHPRSFRLAPPRVAQVFRQTKVVNNYSVNNHAIVNRGFGVERIASATHHAIEPAHVSTLPNAGRQGWRGEGFQRTLRPAAANNYSEANHYAGHDFNTGGAAAGNGQIRRGPETLNNSRQTAPNQPWPQNRGGGTIANEGAPPRGALQPPPRLLVPAEPPHSEAQPNFGEFQGHDRNPPLPPPSIAPSQAPVRNPVTVPSGAANGGNNSGANKQNQNH